VLAALAVAALAACGTTTGGPAAVDQPSPLPTDIAVAVQPLGAALSTAHDAIARAQAQQRIDAGNLQRLRADVAAELAAVRAFDQALSRVPFPDDLRGDEVTHLQQALQQAETWLQTASAAASPDEVQTALNVARQAQGRAQLSATLIARYMGLNAPALPAGSAAPTP
jgi:Zn-dependent alcohol dehydrogenase